MENLKIEAYTLLLKERGMMRKAVMAGVFGFVLLAGTMDVHAETWVLNKVDVPNQNLEANYYDADSVKGHEKTISWTEKFVLTSLGERSYTKHLSQYPACRDNIKAKGAVTYHKMDLEIKEGKFRTVAKRNYNKADELICTDKDMGTELDNKWYEIIQNSPMYNRYYIFVTKFNLGNF